MKKHTGEQEIAVQVRVGLSNRIRRSHHLAGVSKESAAVGVVVETSGGGAFKSTPEFLQENYAEGVQARITNLPS